VELRDVFWYQQLVAKQMVATIQLNEAKKGWGKDARFGWVRELEGFVSAAERVLCECETDGVGSVGLGGLVDGLEKAELVANERARVLATCVLDGLFGDLWGCLCRGEGDGVLLDAVRGLGGLAGVGDLLGWCGGSVSVRLGDDTVTMDGVGVGVCVRQFEVGARNSKRYIFESRLWTDLL
jgi:hypothetical protein